MHSRGLIANQADFVLALFTAVSDRVEIRGLAAQQRD